ncbi:MAG: hypothetical protein RJQ04_13340 [Longimicrobiales bacterium]
MPKRSSTLDENEATAEVVDQAPAESPLDRFTAIIEDARDLLASGEAPTDVAARLWPRVLAIVPKPENPAVQLGRKGGKKGGKARAEKLSAERRSEIARKAARARWGKQSE